MHSLSTETIDKYIRGTKNADTLSGLTGQPNYQNVFDFQDIQLNGKAGNDNITGGHGDDVLLGLAGDDVLRADYGRNFIDGGDGFDLLSYSTYGLNTNILPVDNKGMDITLKGFKANSLNPTILLSDEFINVEGVIGSKYNDQIYGGTANDWIDGAAGGDLIGSEGGDDTIYGGKGFDQIYSGLGNDVIFGGKGSDTIEAAPGDDRIYGGKGADVINPDAGADIIYYKSLADSTTNEAGRDIIKFERGVDKFDVSAIDANANKAGNQVFSWAGLSETFSGKVGEMHYRYLFNNPNGPNYSVIEADVNGDKKADFQVYISDIGQYLSSDFIL
jgi:Ca2+-binding RTX toxin-like protein